MVSGIAVLYWPKLQLPDSPDFKVFSDDHPFEIYDSQFKNMFWFEKTYTVSVALYENDKNHFNEIGKRFS